MRLSRYWPPVTVHLFGRGISQTLLTISVRLGVGYVSRIALANKGDKKPHSVVELSDLLSQLFILLFHEASNAAVRRIAQAVLVFPEKDFVGEAGPAIIEGLHDSVVVVI